MLYKEPRRARAQIGPILAISVSRGPLQTPSKSPGPDLANFGYFCTKRSFTKGPEGPGPRFGQFWLFVYHAVLYKQLRRARAQIWPIAAISALSGRLQRASKGLGPILANFGYFRIKRSFTKSLEGPVYKHLRRARAQIWPILVISVQSGPLQKAPKGPGPDLANFGYLCITRSFTNSFEKPGPRFGQLRLFLY